MSTAKLGYEVMMKDLKDRLIKNKASFDARAVHCKSMSDRGNSRVQGFYLDLSKNFITISNIIDVILAHLEKNELDDAVSVAKNQERFYEIALDKVIKFEITGKGNNFNQNELYEIGMILNNCCYLAEVKAIHVIVEGWVNALKEYSKRFEPYE